MTAAIFAMPDPGSAATKSPREYVPAGAHVLYWDSLEPISRATGGGTIVVKNLTIIGEVRALINALPLSNTRHRVCPDDMTLPITVSFAASAASTPFTRVVFQLGGCPSAEVFERGAPVLPTLGGPNLSRTYAKIKNLISPSALALA
ncbi:MAG: hypothetical protein ACRDVC_10305 [Acidimicrobiales bacterium]